MDTKTNAAPRSGIAQRLANVRQLMEQRSYDAVLIRDEANLRWLTGATGVFDFTGEYPHAAFITADGSWLHTDSRYINSFEERLAPEHPWVLDMDAQAIPEWVAKRVCETHTTTLGIEDDMQLSFHQGLVRALEDRSLAVSLPLMHADLRRMRAIKDEEELALMRHAQSITDAAFEHMCTYIQPGMSEKHIRTELERFMFEAGADGLAFASIVAAGPNSANPHAIPSEYIAQKGDFVLMDYGASYKDYRSDMTRVVVLGKPSDQQREIYDIVRHTHEECARAIKAGVEGNDIHELSRSLIAQAGYGEHYGHGLGHGVGIDIHELPVFGRVKNIIEAGSVITVEPGIYLPGIGGVRLEDFGVVTEKGYEPFTQSTHELCVIDC
ncbi:Xaa-Pro peptidase family protein [Collinsella sp. zg1085]|uniref:M24 family metallopeptidase n=1 Tax=Collinsella sp. zg1085 TaxID=2844380 RepID=UPI001C0C162C|nr:Xaa-Pro peptidase family protein [Collinsella sp. zg1085]QWT17082.1 Xaa-Pro peptidase family protein [Collinsella sp. zg1085]